ncbi:MAG TPA: hypothetical protein VH143_16925 [Kofleriaceae bacterium]|jgi:hypothetical protein|nr:hypothetical protein [Kofleriaceae bacterium]
MRLLPIAFLAACGGAQNPSNSGDQARAPGEVATYSALRWVPDAPAYVMSAATVGDGQRAVRDVIESLGLIVAHATPDDVSQAAHALLGIDPLGADLGQLLGVDLAGGVAMFSEAVSPTFALHLAAPQTTRAFFDHLRSIGMHSTARTVDGVQVDSAPLRDGVTASWAIDGDWFLFHVALAAFDDNDPDAWLVHARHHASAKPSWIDGFEWATRLARHAKPLAGFWNAHATLAKLARIAGDNHGLAAWASCITALGAIDRVGVAMSGDGHFVEGRLAFELGPAARSAASSIVASSIVAPPPGFAGLAAHAPLAVQWNFAIEALATSGVAPCFKAADIDIGGFAELGVRTARAVVETFSPEPPSGTGAVSLDLTSRTHVAKLLDEIPRVAFQSERAFGRYKGVHVSLPLVASMDYVLDDRVAIAAMGDGVLDQLVAGAPPSNVPIFAFDIRPPGLSEATWHFMFDALFGKHTAELMTTELEHWLDGHISLAIDQDALVLDASGNRR